VQKAIGIVMVILAPSLMGFSRALKLRARARFLADFISVLEIMRAEICTRLTPLPELIGMLSKSAPNSCREFFTRLYRGMERLSEECFSRTWTDEVKILRKTVLTDEEFEIVNSLGAILGRYDSQEQKASIDAAIARLSVLADEARIQSGVQGKLWTGLGVAMGIIITIVIV